MYKPNQIRNINEVKSSINFPTQPRPTAEVWHLSHSTMKANFPDCSKLSLPQITCRMIDVGGTALDCHLDTDI